MSERASFRGGRGGRGSGGGEHRGGRGGGARGGGSQGQAEKPKKENILDLTKYMDKEITVKFSGGREGTPAGLDGEESAWEMRLIGANSNWNIEGIRPVDESGIR